MGEKPVDKRQEERELLHNQMILIAEKSKTCNPIHLAPLSAQMVAIYSALNDTRC